MNSLMNEFPNDPYKHLEQPKPNVRLISQFTFKPFNREVGVDARLRLSSPGCHYSPTPTVKT